MYKRLTITLAGLLAATCASAAAEAKGGHHHHRHHWHLRYVHVAPVVVVPSCGFAYAKWQKSGAFHWKKQYYICKGWW